MKELKVTVDPTLPRLGWYATYDPIANTCSVDIGTFVEKDPAAQPQWVVAGFWDGDFAEGRFHQHQHLFGSGLRIDTDGLHVVPASTSVERCVYVRNAHVWHLSNSMLVLLGRIGARLDPLTDHAMWSESPCRGVHAYFRQIPVLHPAASTVSQLIYESLRFGAAGEQTFFFRDRPHTFTSYRDYVDRVHQKLVMLWANATASGRVRKLRGVTTTSRGYDSAAVTALVTEVLPEVVSWSAPRSNTRIPGLLRGLMHVDVLNDDGSEIARQLGATPRVLQGELAKLPAELEALCWASAQTAPELLFAPLLSDAASLDTPTAWFTGHAGDTVWGRRDEVRSTYLDRAAQSGCSLIEARLATGVIDCSVPYLFARDIESINAISNSADMKPWQLDNDYDRPIPRRILEERGVARAAFGHGKKAVAQDFESPVGNELRRVFFEHSGWNERQEAVYRGVNLGLYFANRLLHFVRFQGDRSKLLRSAARSDKRALAKVRDLHRETFLVCVGLLADRYAKAEPSPQILRPPHVEPVPTVPPLSASAGPG